MAEAAAITPANVIASGLCIGCGVCAGKASGATMAWDRFGQRKPVGDTLWSGTPRASFARTCPFSPAAASEDAIAAEHFGTAPHADVRLGRYEANFVGHAEGQVRADGSSGGMVTWVAAELLRRGAVDGVAHVVPVADPQRDGELFRYAISRTDAEVRRRAKSRYYPIHMAQILDEIRTTPGRYAIVGIPCFLKAVQLLRAEEPVLHERIVATLGLFCGHMKSARMVESFAWQMDARIDEVDAIDFRHKDPGRPANWYRSELRLSGGRSAAQDWWHLADGDWGAGFFQNPACDACDDVVAETADIAFGDAWVEPYASDGRGTNVVIVRSPALLAMLREGMAEERVRLTAVDAALVADTQAAGFRHRREGLAYRLTWQRRRLQPVKRVAPSTRGITPRRKLVYRTRAAIAWTSHRMFALARATGRPALYLGWARASLRFYQALTWSHGRLGAAFDRIERALGGSAKGKA